MARIRNSDWILPLLALLMLVIGIAGSCHGQELPKYLVAGHAGADMGSCQAISLRIQEEIAALPHPGVDWTVYVLCTSLDWENVQKKLHTSNRGAVTLRENKLVFLNADMFRAGFDMKGSSPEFAVAHELGHVMLDTDRESKADSWATEQLFNLKKKGN
jgi:hypothetical protein